MFAALFEVSHVKKKEEKKLNKHGVCAWSGD